MTTPELPEPAENAPREWSWTSDAQYRAVVEALHAGVVLMDATGAARAANDSALRILGMASDELLGRDQTDWVSHDELGRAIPENDLPSNRAIRDHAASRDQVIGIRRDDGALIWLSTNTQPMTRPGEDEPFGVVVSFSDITQQREAEAQLREALERLERAFGDSRVGMVIVDAAGVTQAVNAAFCDLVRYDEATLLSSNLTDVLSPEDSNRVLRAPSEEPGRPGAVSLEVPFRRPDGELVPTITHVTPLPESGQVFLHVQDITEWRRIERQLHQAQRAESLRRLTGEMAHDFNNELMVMIGHLEPVIEQVGRGPETMEHLRAIRRSIQRSTRLVDDLVSSSRRQMLDPRPTQLNELLSSEATVLQQILGDDIQLDLDLAEPLPSVVVDPIRLEQVMLNLVLNARDAMRDGGVVRISTGFAEAGAPMTGDDRPHDEESVHIEVADEGTGVPPELMHRIFEPFFTTKARGRGTGLGLSTAQGIIAQSGGTLSVHSPASGGAMFRVRLPIVAEQESNTAGDERDQPEAAKRTAAAVLVVEDDLEVRGVLASILKTGGYRVIEIENDPLHLEDLGRNGVDVALLVADVMMPGVDGSAFARAAVRVFGDGLPVVFVSGHASRDAIDLRGLGPRVRMMRKPFTPRHLISVVDGILAEAGDDERAGALGQGENR